MTEAQRIKLMAYWWPNACQAQGWREGDRGFRMRVLSLCVSFAFQSQQDFRTALRETEPSRVLTSASELNHTTDMNAVITTLRMLADDLDGAAEMENQEPVARTVRRAIADQMKCLALYPLEQPMGTAGARALVAELVNDMFNRGRHGAALTLEDLSDSPQFYRRNGSDRLEEGPSQVRRLVMRLGGLLNKKGTGYRARAGHTLHEMKVASGVDCGCAECAQFSRHDLVADRDDVPAEMQPF